MLSRLQRGITRDILIVLPVSLVSLNFVLMMEKILKLSRLLSGVGASFLDFLYIMILIQPQLLVLTLPMSFLLSLLIVYGRMNLDSEVVVMRAVGMSMRQISVPAFVTGLMVFAVTALMTFYISPMSAQKMRLLMNRTIESRAPLSLEEGVFHDEVTGRTLMIGRKPSPETMGDIFVYDVTDETRPRLITSKEGKILFNEEGDVFFDIRNGHVNIIHEDSFTEIAFERYVFRITLGLELLSEKRAERPTMQLLKEAQLWTGKWRRKFYTEFHRRVTLPLINLFLLFLGPALSMASGRTGKLAGFIYGVAVFSAYYFLLVYVEGLIHSDKIHHLFAWAPLCVIGVFSVYLYKREARK